MKKMSRPVTMGLALTLMILSGCDSTSTKQEEMAPPPIPADVFVLQTSLFQPGTAKTATRVHYLAAALRVWPVSLILSVNLVVPTAVTAAALGAQPVFEDGAWKWTATTTSEGSTFTFTLTARPSLSGFDWSMRISSDGSGTGPAFDNFELYTAHTALTGTTGDWQLFYPIEGIRTNVLNADFDFSGDTDVTTFSLPKTLPEHGGDSVRYEVNGNDRRFFWQQIAESLDHDVNWDAVTRAGAIVATNYNGGDMGCWDAQLDDVACAN